MKNLLAPLLLLALAGFTSPAPVAPHGPAAPAHVAAAAPAPAATVYVCMSKNSVAYHSRDNCGGLSRCSHEIKSMSTAAAGELGKRACQKCY